MPLINRVFKIIVVNKGFVVQEYGIDPAGTGAETLLDVTAHESVSSVGRAMWEFLKPYSTTLTVEGALPEIPE